MKRFLLLAVAALTLVGCNNVFEDAGNSSRDVRTMPTLVAGFEDAATRTYVEYSRYLHWHEGEFISVFYGNTIHHQYKFDGKRGDYKGTFSYVQSIGVDDAQHFDGIYSLYPYDVTTEIDESGDISYYFPATQEYVEKSFGKEANTMVAKTENIDDIFLAFKNVGGFLKVKLYGGGTVTSIRLKGNNGEKISGLATIRATYNGEPEVIMSDEATDTIILDCGNGVKLSTDAENPTEFWFVIPPVEFTKGITIVAYSDRASYEFTKRTESPISIVRNEIQPMKALRASFYGDTGNEQFPGEIPNDEIWYTSNDGEIVEPYVTDVFGANILYNIYDADKCIIKFDGDVTSIGDKAFYNCDNLTSVTIPDGVTTLGNYAFYDCDTLTNVVVGDGVTTIGDYTFRFCDNLTKIIIGHSVTAIGEYAFAGNYSGGNKLTTITMPNSLTTIGDYAFYYCEGLTSVVIPDSVTALGNYAFYGCDSLTDVEIGDAVTVIGDYAFCACHNLTNLIIGQSVATIGEYTFGNYSTVDNLGNKLITIKIPDSVVEIKECAFANCVNLKSVNFGKGVTEIGESAFSSCDSLMSLVIPDNVTKIGQRAFIGCDALKKADIGDGVTIIGEFAFNGCKALTTLTLGENVEKIEDWGFAYCVSLRKIYCNSTTPPSLGDFVFNYDVDNRKIYVPEGCVSSYASSWYDYRHDIVGYDGSDNGLNILPSIGDGAVIK